MKKPPRYQLSEYERSPVSLLNAMSFLDDRIHLAAVRRSSVSKCFGISEEASGD